MVQQLLQDYWAVSDSKKAFEQSLKEYGLYLARGDGHGFVAIDYRGEVYYLSRWLNVNSKE